MEHLVGHDAEPARHRMRAALRKHPVAAAFFVALAGVALAAASAWSIAAQRPTPQEAGPPLPPDGTQMRVGTTGGSGTVVSRESGRPVIRMELKVDLTAPTGANAQVRGAVGPGIVESTASMPQLAAGASVVGLVTASLDCAATSTDSGDYGIEATVSAPEAHGIATAPMGSAATRWLRLVEQACRR